LHRLVAHYDTTRPALTFLLNPAATSVIYTLSLHDALPIYGDPASLVLHQKERAHGGPIASSPQVSQAESARLQQFGHPAGVGQVQLERSIQTRRGPGRRSRLRVPPGFHGKAV